MWFNRNIEIKNLTKSKIENRSHIQKEMNSKTKVDINILLNKVKIEKKNAIKKNFIITFGALGTVAITGLIAIL